MASAELVDPHVAASPAPLLSLSGFSKLRRQGDQTGSDRGGKQHASQFDKLPMTVRVITSKESNLSTPYPSVHLSDRPGFSAPFLDSLVPCVLGHGLTLFVPFAFCLRYSQSGQVR